ncbi:CPBP family intramembrane glutamic endopeptidase [Inconstantimicrobium mannanitabidum]|uniref:Uncharacterized protein n=1 Tax=Inconstantimicrobium mannanitabidum TaxID=1604901 RepID=A0ACB5R9K6_9CLOT|nr:CPBP family intramembrane glutamic endopeptidase [Clostridium sp. TW13]GKX65698.1 hypothetical protein rsdtw13_09560 [Clostridium sp. TW13]
MSKKFSKLQTILLVLLIMFIGFIVILLGLPKLISFISSQLGYKLSSKDLMTNYTVGTIVRLIGVVTCFIFMKIIGITKEFKWSFNRKYIAFSWLFFIYIILNFELIDISSNMIFPIIMMIISCLFVGLYEEIVFRGLILSLVLKHWGETKKGVYFSVIFSSSAFGLMHLINLFDGANVISVVAQVFYATIIGIFFSALLLRTNNNLLWCALLHAIYDIASGFEDFIPKSAHGASNNVDILPVLINLAEFTPLLILGLFLLRKIANVSSDGTVILTEKTS